MLRQLALAAALVALAALPALVMPARAADIGVTPVAVQLDEKNDRASVSVVNSGKEAVIMQVEAVAWKRAGAPSTNAAADDTPSPDIIVNPPVFTVQPGQAQVVRVGLRRNAPGPHEETYRIVLREVPSARANDGRISGQVQVLMALRVPIYVSPAKVVRQAAWRAVSDTQGNVVASVQNQGNVHMRIGQLRLVPATAADAGASAAPVIASVEGPVAGGVIFAGEGRQFKLKPAGLLTAGRPMMLEVSTDQGSQQFPIELARR
jgi:fimbrial chaperone protein